MQGVQVRSWPRSIAADSIAHAMAAGAGRCRKMCTATTRTGDTAVHPALVPQRAVARHMCPLFWMAACVWLGSAVSDACASEAWRSLRPALCHGVLRLSLEDVQSAHRSKRWDGPAVMKSFAKYSRDCSRTGCMCMSKNSSRGPLL